MSKSIHSIYFLSTVPAREIAQYFLKKCTAKIVPIIMANSGNCKYKVIEQSNGHIPSQEVTVRTVCNPVILNRECFFLSVGFFFQETAKLWQLMY